MNYTTFSFKIDKTAAEQIKKQATLENLSLSAYLKTASIEYASLDSLKKSNAELTTMLSFYEEIITIADTRFKPPTKRQTMLLLLVLILVVWNKSLT